MTEMNEGLTNVKYALLQQEVDQLEWCIPMLPFPNKCIGESKLSNYQINYLKILIFSIGIPCLPCDLANNFALYQSDETFSCSGSKIADINEISTVKDRACIPSLRPFSLSSRNFYNQEIITAKKPLKFPFFQYSRPEIYVNFHGKNYLN